MICKILCIVLILLGLALPCNAAVEDFTTYTEVDTAGVITITSTKIQWASVNTREGEAERVNDDKGAGTIGNYTHTFTMESALGDGGAYWLQGWWGVSNQDGDITAWSSGQYIHGVRIQAWPYEDFTFTFGDAGNSNTDTFNTNEGNVEIIFYPEVVRSGTTGTCTVYTDLGRTNIEDTLSITTATTTYRYVYGFFESAGSGWVGRVASGYTENLDVDAGTAAPTFTPKIIFF